MRLNRITSPWFPNIFRLLAVIHVALFAFAISAQAQTTPVLQKFISEIPASEFIEGATAYGPSSMIFLLFRF